MMGKISFLLGLQISQSPRGIFINQSKYALESLKKYGFESCDPVDTPMVEKSKDEDKEGKAVDPSHYCGMIGTRLYLIANRPNLQFAICMCTRYQAWPTEKHVHAVKRIFRYLRGTVHRGLWYSKDSSVALTAFADADHAGCQDTRRNSIPSNRPTTVEVPSELPKVGMQNGVIEIRNRTLIEAARTMLTYAKALLFLWTEAVATAFSSIPEIVNHYMDQRMNEAVKVAVQIQSDRFRDETQRENDEFLRTVDENIKKIIKEQVKEQVKAQVFKILPRIKQAVNEQLEAEVLTRSYSSRTSYVVAVDLSEMELKKIFIENIEGNKRAGRSTIGSRSRQASASESALAEEPVHTTSPMEEPSHPEFDTGADNQPIVQSSQHPEWFSQQQKPPTSDRAWNKTLPGVYRSIQPWISELAKQADTRSSFNELIDTPLDFFNFLMNQLRVDTLTPKLLAGPTYKLMKGSCKSMIELEYHLEEVYKAITDQLDWVNLEGQQYPYNLLQRLPLIPDNRGHRVIPFEHFINNDLEYLRGDIEDMLLLLVQGKLTNLTVEERFAFNVSLWMFTRSIVIQRRVEDLQLGVKSYQKRLNLTKSDTYRSDLKRKEAYTAYSNPRGFIYQNKDKKNRLMRIDKLHKFSDGTLTDVCTALDDRLKGIRMRYPPQTIWRKK
nr:uncharacterized mitochondrial protein AtMg00810-like [Tanacetum cinerariifolium]